MRVITALTGTAGLAALLFGGIGYCYYLEDQVVTFANHADAVTGGAVRSGVVPSFVPASAADIRAVRNIDTDRTWLRFGVPERDARAMVKRLVPITYGTALASTGKPPRWRGSWPSELRHPPLVTPRGNLGYFRDPAPGSGARCLAVEWAPIATVYAWSC